MSLILSALVIACLLVLTSAAGPVGQAARGLCAAWSFGMPGVGELITGAIVGHLIVYTCVLLVGLASMGRWSMYRLSRARQATRRQRQAPLRVGLGTG